MWILKANKARERNIEESASASVVENRSELNEPIKIPDEVVAN